MANVEFGPFFMPALPTADADDGLALTNMTIDAASEKAAALFWVPKDGEIAKIGFTTRTVATGADVDVRLETVSLTTGDPTGTLVDTNANATQTVDSADDTTQFLVTLTATATVTAGMLLAIVVVMDPGTPGDIDIARGRYYNFDGMPYTALETAGSYSKNRFGGVGLVEYDDGTRPVCMGLLPAQELTNTGFNSGSTPDEIGNRFILPFRGTVRGVWVELELDNDCDIVLYDSDGTTALATTSLDANQRSSADRVRFLVQFPNSPELAANTVYRWTVKPTTGSNVSINRMVVGSAPYMDALPGGQAMHRTERTDAGAWTETTTERITGGLYLGATGGPGGRLAGNRLAG